LNEELDERGPRDYSPWDDERRVLVNIIRKQTERGGGGNYTEGGNGEKGLLKWLLGIAASLLVVSVVGGISMYGRLSAIEANQSAQAAQQSRMQNQIDQLADSVQTIARRP
jgi:hypothetical protein